MQSKNFVREIKQTEPFRMAENGLKSYWANKHKQKQNFLFSSKEKCISIAD